MIVDTEKLADAITQYLFRKHTKANGEPNEIYKGLAAHMRGALADVERWAEFLKKQEEQ